MSVLIAIASITTFIIDGKLYYYGKNEWGIHDKLPFKIIPEYWGYDRGMLGFVLTQNDGTLIAPGNKYWDYPNISISEVIKYGFNKEKIVTLINDSLGKEYYVVCTKNNDIHSKQELKITVVAKTDFINNEQLKWINIKNVSTEITELARNYLEILSMLLIFILIYYLLKNRKKTATV